MKQQTLRRKTHFWGCLFRIFLLFFIFLQEKLSYRLGTVKQPTGLKQLAMAAFSGLNWYIFNGECTCFNKQIYGFTLHFYSPYGVKKTTCFTLLNHIKFKWTRRRHQCHLKYMLCCFINNENIQRNNIKTVCDILYNGVLTKLWKL